MSLTESQINMLQKQNEVSISDNKYLNGFIAFWLYVFKKIIFSLISVKVWAFIGIVWVSTYVLVNGFINGANFAAILCTLITTVLVSREVAKMSFNSAAEKVMNTVAPEVAPVVDVIKNKILMEDDRPSTFDDQ